jgi:hypothetical protein
MMTLQEKSQRSDLKLWLYGFALWAATLPEYAFDVSSMSLENILFTTSYFVNSWFLCAQMLGYCGTLMSELGSVRHTLFAVSLPLVVLLAIVILFYHLNELSFSK